MSAAPRNCLTQNEVGSSAKEEPKASLAGF